MINFWIHMHTYDFKFLILKLIPRNDKKKWIKNFIEKIAKNNIKIAYSLNTKYKSS